MLFSLRVLKTAADQREEKSNPSRRLPCRRISEITSKKKETFNCLMPLCSTWPWLRILEAPKVSRELKYPVTERRPFLPGLTEGQIMGMLQKYGGSDFLDSCSFAKVWEKKKKNSIWKVVEGTEATTPRLLSHPEHGIFNFLVWKHPWMSPHTVEVQICGSLY